MPYEHPAPPSTPSESEWRFTAQLAKTPYHQPIHWKKRKPLKGEVNLAAGLCLRGNFPDPHNILQTAYNDFAEFLRCAGLKNNGPYSIHVRQDSALAPEAYNVKTGLSETTLTASDADGVRRGLIWIEDEMQRRCGPFLALGRTSRVPWVRTRISRCFFGPINRPPKLKEELAEDANYYPDEYLNRLAHEGVNGLWLTINWFRDLPSAVIPEYGKNSAPRLARLRRTVEQCARYGIRIYAFCIEPAGFRRPEPELKAAAAAHPELVGHNRAFCISTKKGKAYVEDAVRTLFSAVPGLGGLIVISVGERQTHCFSGSGFDASKCPRCKKRTPFAVLNDTLSAMRRGMDAVRPDAELISWPYGQFITWGAELAVTSAGRLPHGVCMQHNFETGGHCMQLGKPRPLWDYWQSVPGPTVLFRKCAQAARKNKTRTFAKLQVACGHEITTTQYVPAPGLLHTKYAAMRALGVSGAMLSWYPGSYPCVMIRASTELSFTPNTSNKNSFLLDLARRDWGDSAPQVAEAWKLCESAYTNYPAAHIFQYYGPMHDGIAWPLYLIPRRRPLSPFWQLHYPPSGDYIAECVTNGFTYNEILTLCKRMAEQWERGANIMKRLPPKFTRHPDRRRDIIVTTALGLQLRSGYEILRFYGLREQLADARTSARRLAILCKMKNLVRSEVKRSREFLSLAKTEPVLGFSSEAEGYKYWPALIRWRIQQLTGLLKKEFPEVEKRASQPKPLFPEYTGETPSGLVYKALRVSLPRRMQTDPAAAPWAALATATCVHGLRHVHNYERWKICGYDAHDHIKIPARALTGKTAKWKACYDEKHIYFTVTCPHSAQTTQGTVQVLVEPSRMQPRIIFSVTPTSAKCQKDDGYIKRPASDNPWRIWRCSDSAQSWSFILQIPLRWLQPLNRKAVSRLRVNVQQTLIIQGEPGEAIVSWAHRKPVKGRLVWGILNPATDFGWLVLG